MNRSILSLFSAASLALAGSGAALAEEHPAGHESGGHGGGDYPTAVIDRPLELPKGMFELHANILASLSASIDGFGGETIGGPFKPTYLGLGAAYGVDGHLQIGVSTNGFCLTGTSGGCDKVFDDFAVEAAYGVLHQKGFELSLQGGVEFARFDATEVAVGLGVDLKVTSGQFAIRAGPKLQFGLTQRDGLNREYLQIPIIFQFQVDQHLALEAGVALNLGIDPPDGVAFGNWLGIPVQVGALYAVDKHLDLGAIFGFSNLLGKESVVYGRSGIDDRFLQIFCAYRL
jgi:hypothetical protein